MTAIKPVSDKGLQILNLLQADPEGNYTAADIADKLGYEKRTVDGVITSGLIRGKDLAVRIPAEIEMEDGSHKPIKLIKLTDAGMNYNHEAAKAAYEAEQAAASVTE